MQKRARCCCSGMATRATPQWRMPTRHWRTSTQKPKLELIRQAAEIQVNAGTRAAENSHSGDGTLEELIGNIAGHRVELKPGAHLENDLNLSSLDRVELMAAIESRYQV